jgi:hypothetical protein
MGSSVSVELHSVKHVATLPIRLFYDFSFISDVTQRPALVFGRWALKL